MMNHQTKRTSQLWLLGIIVSDFTSALLAVCLGLRLRFGFVREIPSSYFDHQWQFVLTVFFLFTISNFLFSVYQKSVGVTPVPLFLTLSASCLMVFFVLLVVDRVMGYGVPFEAIMIVSLLLLVYSVAARILLEKLRMLFRGAGGEPGHALQNAAIYGAGELGVYLAARLGSNMIPSMGDAIRPRIFLDDSPDKIGQKFVELPVISPEDFPRAAQKHRIDLLIIAINKPQVQKIRDILSQCGKLGIKVKRFGMFDNIQDISSEKIRNVKVEQLLGRRDITLDMTKARIMLTDATVMVTGGAGSIGSEICRQVLSLGCRQLIVFDINENGLFYLDRKLKQSFPNGNYKLCVGSVRDYDRLDHIMETYHPQILLHAAAHKHVPMMELNPSEALKNNFVGTYNTAKAAVEAGVSRFILISTDKAVNPANIMGASKRMAELVMKTMDIQSQTIFSAVRFGNVLGSVGSVVPIFRKQIEKGEAVTITHPDMKRYFMTIPEAVGLVLDAGAMAHGGEIFVLDMGEPVKIVDLASEMIRLSGLEPGRDIEIRYTGIRPGEKLYEEIRTSDENVMKTENNKIYINRSQSFEPELTISVLEQFSQNPERMPLDKLKELVKQLVPTYDKK